MSTHSAAFEQLVNEARTRVHEIAADELANALRQHTDAAVIDTREQDEYSSGHLQGAVWLGKGIIERDIVAHYPDLDQPLYLYCGGGFRSVLAADNLQRMGYTRVVSVDGGWKALQHLLPIE